MGHGTGGFFCCVGIVVVFERLFSDDTFTHPEVRSQSYDSQ